LQAILPQHCVFPLKAAAGETIGRQSAHGSAKLIICRSALKNTVSGLSATFAPEPEYGISCLVTKSVFD
jgi:hypothetical protein